MKKALIVHGNLYIGHIDIDRLKSFGGEMEVLGREEIKSRVEGVHPNDIKTVGRDVYYENVYIEYDVQFLIYSTESITVLDSPKVLRSNVVVPAGVERYSTYTTVSGIINPPISVSEPYKTLGVGTRSKGWDVGYICSNLHGKINPYAKFKTVIDPDMFASNNARGTYWYRSSKYYSATQPCGISVTKLGNNVGERITSANIAKRVEWRESYNPPTGGTASPFRLADFNGYNHLEDIPFGCTYPQSSTLFVGDKMEGDSYKSMFMGGFVGDPLNFDRISALDMASSFMYKLPAGSYGIVGFLAEHEGSVFIKTVNVTASNSIPLVNLNISETKEAMMYGYVVDKGSTYLYPVFCNKEVPYWKLVSDVGNELEVILFPKEFSGSLRTVYFKKITEVIVPNYVMRAYKYGSNFKEPFAPLLNPVQYNGEDSKLDIELEVIVPPNGNGSINVIPNIGYRFTTLSGYNVVQEYPSYEAGAWTKATYDGKTVDAYHFKRYTIKDMYRKENGYEHKVGSLPIYWTSPNDPTITGSFYIWLE